jgi:hypothetical protein
MNATHVRVFTSDAHRQQRDVAGTRVGDTTDETARRGVWRRNRNLMEVI